MIIMKLRKRDGIYIDYIFKAMNRLSAEGFETVVVQSTHIINGEEYDVVVRIVSAHREHPRASHVGAMLTTSED